MNKSAILGDWVHAHERDKAGAKVYVDAVEPLPSSRGRQRLSFRADGTFVEGLPGPDDRAVEASGTYQFDGANLVLQRAGGADPVAYEAACDQNGKLLQLKKA